MWDESFELKIDFSDPPLHENPKPSLPSFATVDHFWSNYIICDLTRLGPGFNLIETCRRRIYVTRLRSVLERGRRAILVAFPALFSINFDTLRNFWSSKTFDNQISLKASFKFVSIATWVFELSFTNLFFLTFLQRDRQSLDLACWWKWKNGLVEIWKGFNEIF